MKRILICILMLPVLAFGDGELSLVFRHIGRANKMCLAKQALGAAAGSISVNSLATKATDMVRCLPDSDPAKQGLLQFLEILGLNAYGPNESIRGANEGIIQFFQKTISTDKKFEETLLAFLDDVAKTQIIDPSFIFVMRSRPLFHRPTLQDEMGKAYFTKAKPGWIWQLALKHANDDVVLALRLIAVCGNDEVLIRQILLSNGKPLQCPLQPGYFIPKSLGLDADIPEALKDRIVKFQFSKSSALHAPAKYYHVYSNAFLACELMSKGVSAEEARDVVKAVAAIYRAIRIREYEGEYNRAVSVYRNSNAKERMTLDQYLEWVRHEHWRGEPNLERRPKFVRSDLVRFDAIFLMTRWGLGTQVPLLGAKLYTDLKISPAHRTDIPAGWSRERFEEALTRLESFVVDSDWTAAQAEVGAQFAASVGCSQNPTDGKLPR